ncbi:hypothetical protein H8356DRAFT_1354153 [Neocallimastix lanati (nom. inval.)]|nr:hypothetical protein H8356DRAFT_1354153 [Neocallimastix sp. JGI-2020a]
MSNMACEIENEDIVNYLVGFGADINKNMNSIPIKNVIFGEIPLFNEVKKWKCRFIDINIEDKYKQTVLFNTCQNRNEKLVKCKADIEKEDSEKLTSGKVDSVMTTKTFP